MINFHIEAQAIQKAVEGAQNILLVAHKKPDADTLGSCLAWSYLLSNINKTVHLYCADPVPEYLKHLPGSHAVSDDHALFQKELDLIIVNDSGDLEYAGVNNLIAQRNNTNTTLINIDHHATNPKYGDLNLVIPNASSTTEIIAWLFTHWNIPITQKLAEVLLHGIVTDTDSLMNPATSYRSLSVAAGLVRQGANLYSIVNQTLHNRSVAELSLWGIALSRLRHNHTYNIVSTYLTHEDFKLQKVDTQAAEGIINYLTLIPDVGAILMLTVPETGSIKGSLRTTRPDVDVSKLAKLCGGGGHKKAAGFKMRGKIIIEGNHWTVA